MLEKYEVAFSDTQVHDCTSYNITVEVRSGETFIVNEYTLSDNLYFFSADEYPIIEMNGYSGIVVDESTYAIFINNNQLIVDLSPLDGPRYFFNKIKD